MNTEHSKYPETLQALIVHQWLEQWDEYQFRQANYQARPEPHFYLFTVPAAQLRVLSGIQPRSVQGGLKRSEDLGIQRKHDPERSQEIGEFIRYGYPWSKLSSPNRSSGRYDDLRKPGWLPTAIVVNILTSSQTRRGQRKVAEQDTIQVEMLTDKGVRIHLPSGSGDLSWRPQELPPIEVIDGQHRLWAFDQNLAAADFELPVVAFHGLDISWQAYLFWTINITPKRINPSLAFDLYPLLRTQDWLERFEGPAVYRETRAQELVEILWSYPGSPWFQRINMLGEPGVKGVTQAAWVRALLQSYIKAWAGRGVRGIGGLFGAKPGQDEIVLPWSRLQQASFLIYLWRALANAILSSDVQWAMALRSDTAQLALPIDSIDVRLDPAFAGPHSLLNTDQGVRGFLLVTNDLFYALYDRGELDLDRWTLTQDVDVSEDSIRDDLEQLSADSAISSFTDDLARALAQYDWRSADSPGLSEDEANRKAAFRGSGGYRILRQQLLRHLAGVGGQVAKVAQIVSNIKG